MKPLAPIGSTTTHVWIPLAVFVVVAILLETTRIDMWLADAIYRWEGGAWSLRRDPIVRDLLHGDAKRVIGVVYGALVLGCALSFLARPAAPIPLGLRVPGGGGGGVYLDCCAPEGCHARELSVVGRSLRRRSAVSVDMARSTSARPVRPLLPVGARGFRLCAHRDIFLLPVLCAAMALVRIGYDDRCRINVRNRAAAARRALSVA